MAFFLPSPSSSSPLSLYLPPSIPPSLPLPFSTRVYVLMIILEHFYSIFHDSLAYTLLFSPSAYLHELLNFLIITDLFKLMPTYCKAHYVFFSFSPAPPAISPPPLPPSHLLSLIPRFLYIFFPHLIMNEVQCSSRPI